MESETAGEAMNNVSTFHYPVGDVEPEAPLWECWERAHEPVPHGPAQGLGHVGHGGEPGEDSSEYLPRAAQAAAEAALRADWEKRLIEETRKAHDAGRERGRQEGQKAERDAGAAALAVAGRERTRQAAELIEAFVVERDAFLQRAEQEVVQLALAVAVRILRREAQMDPLLLTGAVRVALGQLSSTTAVRLRVPPAELDLWREAMALVPNLPIRPTVVAGEGMRLGDCSIETELGSVDLGVRSQLGEIERGFFDRVGASQSESAPVAPAATEANGERVS